MSSQRVKTFERFKADLRQNAYQPIHQLLLEQTDRAASEYIQARQIHDAEHAIKAAKRLVLGSVAIVDYLETERELWPYVADASIIAQAEANGVNEEQVVSLLFSGRTPRTLRNICRATANSVVPAGPYSTQELAIGVAIGLIDIRAN